jgi:DNA primase catalytic core
MSRIVFADGISLDGFFSRGACMARIADAELERLKKAVSVERLAEARGVKLRRHGADLLGLCPFHDDREPSLVVSPEKNLWHCLGACQAGGSAIDWVMRAEGVSFRLAVELLRKDVASPSSSLASEVTGPPPKRASVVKLPRLVSLEEPDEALLLRVVNYYHATLRESPEALAYLESRGIRNAEMVAHFRMGYANRTLGYRLPQKNRVEGDALRGRLVKLGILRESGHEHFNGSLVIPIFDESGTKVVGMYGRKITPRLTKGTPLHLYLPGPHRGVWNAAGACSASGEVVLCEALIDALTFWCAGYRNVTASYGVEGFTEAHGAMLERTGAKVVRIAYDRDAAGDRAAETLSAELNAQGIETYRVQFPKGMDANAYAKAVVPAHKSLGLALRQACWMGKGSAPRVEEADVAPALAAVPTEPAAAADELVAEGDDLALRVEGRDAPDASASEAREASDAWEGESPTRAIPSLAASLSPSASRAAEEHVTPTPDVAAAPPHAERDEMVFVFGERRWRVRGLGKNLSFGQMRVNVGVSRTSGGFFVDTADLYAAKHRASFVRQAATDLGVAEDVLKRDLGELLLGLEKRQEEQIASALAPKTTTVAMTETEREEALALLRDPHLLARVAEDFESCGVVGEQTNKLVGYLAAVSRKLEEPLAVVIQSSSAAGKSRLMDAVLAFVPEEERVSYSAMTGQSLFYMGEDDLKHKVLAVVEEEGAERASYALKLLQSEGELTIASTGKDPLTGKLVTHTYRVAGPVGLFLTTTAITVDEELLNRCIVLTVDEGQAQTRAIHVRQRESQTLEGLVAKVERQRTRALHQNAQRLLQPLVVVNPFARELVFADSRTRTRRDHMKYLTLIRTVALLHQHQREVKTTEHRGQLIRYIEATREDIAVAETLARAVLGRGLDELPPQTRRLCELVEAMVAERATAEGTATEHVRFSRREVREHTGWGHTQVKVHMQRLEELEYVHVHRGVRGQGFVYALALTSAAAGTTQKWSWWSGGGRPMVGGEAAHSSGASAPYLSSVGGSTVGVVGVNGDHVVGAKNGAPSYVNGSARAETP